MLFCLLGAIPSLATGDSLARAGARELAAARARTKVSRVDALRQSATRRYLTHRIAEVDVRRRYWLRLMHRPLPAASRHLSGLSLADLRRAADWRARRAAALAQAAHHPPHLSGWLCIQRHETAAPYPGWRTDSGNGYFGGLQFDRSFQVAYADWLYRSKGTAENWTPLEQIWTAEFALGQGRGFTPWPNSARACGLL